MKEHVLKTWPEPFQALLEGRKTFEFRKNDREFEVGDALLLQEWQPEMFQHDVQPGAYTGREKRVFVTYMVVGPAFGIPDGYVVMSIDHYHSGWVPGDPEPAAPVEEAPAP